MQKSKEFDEIRNVAIIAHVDHGKTTLIDGMLKQTQMFRENQAEMEQDAILDQNDLEREKGITILAKNTSVFYNSGDKKYKINIIDTPGHADFSGEVERVINMADGALLIVDAAEGPLAQTKFVLQQAFQEGLKVIVVINKIDRKDAEPQRVKNEIEELFLNLAQHESQLEFPILYAVGKEGKVWLEDEVDLDDLETLRQSQANIRPLFEKIISFLPAPKVDDSQPFKMMVSNLDFDNHKGVQAIGKLVNGKVTQGQKVKLLLKDKRIGQGEVKYLLTTQGLEWKQIDEATPGDIIAIAGIEDILIGQTLAENSVEVGFEPMEISEPTLKILIGPNSSPFVGKEGEFCTARQIENRLMTEKKTNIGLKMEAAQRGGFIVSGRGELHLAVLIENMRRDGYEMEVGKPEVIIKEIDGRKHEPVEEFYVEINEAYIGVITEELGKRFGQLQDSKVTPKGVAKMTYKIPSKNLLGFRSDILTKTRGNGLFNTRFLGYEPYQDNLRQLRNGVIIASESGTTTAYAIESLQERGESLVKPGIEVYEGMIVGIGKTQHDLEMNICKSKKLTNFRSNAEVMTVIAPPKDMSLEQSLDFIEADELLEVTPKSLRLRKKHLSQKARVKAAKRKSQT